ncbi:MAG: DUF2461 domain-containing protein [Candidatus Dormibacteraceae bacterium]
MSDTLDGMTAGFQGWRGDFQGFFLGLRANNTKAYFAAHRRQYEQDVKAPMVALLAELEPEFGAARLSRPNRDIRFAADKSPYKTNIYASAPAGGYVSLDATGLVAAGGRYMLEPFDLARFRAAAAVQKSGAELARAVAALRDKGYEIGDPELKRVPPPHPQDHPRAELLRHKRLIYWRRWDIAPWIATPKVRERVVEAWRDGAALSRWLAAHVDDRAPAATTRSRRRSV